MVPIWVRILGIVFVVLIFTAAVVGFADAAAPGDPLYGVDRQVEALRLRFAKSAESIQALEFQFEQERYYEFEILAQRDQSELLEVALHDLDQELLAEDSDWLQTASKLSTPIPNEDETEDGAQDERSYCREDAQKQHPQGEKLAEAYGVSYEDILALVCDGSSFGDVKQAYEISQAAEVSVDEVLAKRQEGAGWGEIKKAYDLVGGDPSAEEEEPEDGEPKGGAYCDGSQEGEHPAGVKLAEQYGASYEKIMTWFCAGHGFGQIGMAFRISQQAGVSVEDVFSQRESGAGWGQIMKEYNLTGKNKAPKEKYPKPTKKPKKTQG